MRTVHLNGWNVDVQKQQIMVQNPDGVPGDMIPGEGWVLIFQEQVPQSGDSIVFAFGREVRDEVVRKLTGGLVLAGGEFPKL
jgi:hypothetical protein